MNDDLNKFDRNKKNNNKIVLLNIIIALIMNDFCFYFGFVFWSCSSSYNWLLINNFDNSVAVNIRRVEVEEEEDNKDMKKRKMKWKLNL